VVGTHAHAPFGTYAQAPRQPPALHIQVASKAAWFEIRDDLPQYSEFPS
jgi:hypothetical protein